MRSHEERAEKQYFIDRAGKVHKYDGDASDITSIHYEIARRLYPEARNPDDTLMSLGWIMMGSSCYHHPIIHKKPTQAQINYLDGIGEYSKLTFLYNGFYENYDKNQELCE